jgi:hypothetical protein
MKTYVKICRGRFASITGYIHGDLERQNPRIKKVLVYVPNRLQPLHIKLADIVKARPLPAVRFQLDLFEDYLSMIEADKGFAFWAARQYAKRSDKNA